MKKFLLCMLAFVIALPCFGFSQQKEETRKLPVVMYHSILRSVKNRYTVSPELLASDLDLLLESGYRTVTLDELIAFTKGKGDLPKRPVLITFDDGYYNNMYYAESVLAQKKCRAVLNVVGSFSDKSIADRDVDHPNYSYLTWEEIAKLSDNGIFEIGNHTYAMHGYAPRFGMDRIKGETDGQYRAALVKDIGLQQEKLAKATGIVPRCFAYPFGKITETAQTTVESMGFCVTLTCKVGLNTVKKGDPSSLLHLSRYNREPEGIEFGGVKLPAV